MSLNKKRSDEVYILAALNDINFMLQVDTLVNLKLPEFMDSYSIVNFMGMVGRIFFARTFF